MQSHTLTRDQLEHYARDGFVIVRERFDREEVELLEAVGRKSREIQNARAMKDASGAESKIWITAEAKTDIYNAYAYDPRIVCAMEQLLGGAVYVWHYKMMLKEPRVGGAWEWHQDYGYWYKDHCLTPDLASCMVGVNKADRENGCLQVLRGSHRIGRINHDAAGGQTGADPERIAAAEKRFELVYAELNPGDALYFHANLLHRSDQNRSERPRWAFICCYNAMDNVPYAAHGHGEAIPARPWAEGEIKRIGKAQLAALG